MRHRGRSQPEQRRRSHIDNTTGAARRHSRRDYDLITRVRPKPIDLNGRGSSHAATTSSTVNGVMQARLERRRARAGEQVRTYNYARANAGTSHRTHGHIFTD
jgi:hypothetical protein